MAKPTPVNTTAKQWFSDGVTEHGGARLAMQSLKEKAILAGWFFLQAKAACSHGEWSDLVAAQKAIPERTVQRYMGFTLDAIATVVGAQRELEDHELRKYEPTPNEIADKKILDAAKRAVIHSSQGSVELARELQLFRKFGEYDAVKHSAATARAAKAGAPIQFSFDFGVAMAGLRSIDAIDRASMDKLPTEKLPELRDKLRSALGKVEARLGELKSTMEAEVVT